MKVIIKSKMYGEFTPISMTYTDTIGGEQRKITGEVTATELIPAEFDIVFEYENSLITIKNCIRTFHSEFIGEETIINYAEFMVRDNEIETIKLINYPLVLEL